MGDETWFCLFIVMTSKKKKGGPALTEAQGRVASKQTYRASSYPDSIPISLSLGLFP
jgi:hypothetical protein